MHAAFALKPLLLIISSLLAQHAIAADSSNIINLPTVPVTGNPLGVSSDELVIPISVLNGRELSFKRESTLGDTLNGIPGVSATSFGPNSSRPVIRGLDAERVRIMQNGLGILDASSLSFDHAVSLDPLVIEQIDVIRGPAALLYGGSAVGGVVNAIDHRIPTEKLDGISGRADASVGGANSQNNLAGVMDVGNGRIAIHADAYTRKSSDLDIPGYAVSKRKYKQDNSITRDNRGRLVNSSSDSEGGALGASLTFDNGYAGISYSGFRNNYGTVAEPTVRADMQSDRWDFASEFKELGGMIERVKFKLAHTDYQHQEIDNGEVGTTFKNRGLEGSFEAGHASIGNIKGVVGFQFQNSNFEALGDEAFVPSVNTQSKGLYLYEELPLNQFKLSFGGRVDRVALDAGAFNDNPSRNNSFTPLSYAFGGLYTFNPNWSLATNLSHNERAPSYFELYADGPHLATGQYERGSSNIDKERSNGIDAQIRWKDGRNSFNFGAYYTRFSNFIGLLNTGTQIDSLQEAQFSTFAATFKGLEADGRFNIADNLDLTLRGDYVRASNRDNGDPLPRIAPLRLGAGLHYQKNSLGARVDVLHAFKQERTAENELKTDGYTNLSALVSYKLPTKVNLEVYAKANNLLNEEIREHTSFLKDFAPLGGRSLLLGLRADF